MVESALFRISAKQSGSSVETELMNSREARVGMEFMQSIVEATARDSNTNRIILLVQESSLTSESIKTLRNKTLQRFLSLQRFVKFIVKIQRWYRFLRGKKKQKRTEGNPLNNIFAACTGGSRNVDHNASCFMQ
jgi:hypothetical protein